MNNIILAADIFYLSLIEVVVAFMLTYVIDNYVFFENYTTDMDKSTPRLLLEAGGAVGLFMVLVQGIAHYIQKIPLPLHGMFGYKPRPLEFFVYYQNMLVVFAIIFSDTINSKIDILRKRHKSENKYK